MNTHPERIATNSRAEAIADGSLVDVTDTSECKECGIKYPIALTRAVYEDCVLWTKEDKKPSQDEKGRLWDILYMFALQAKRAVNSSSSSFSFEVYVVPRKGRGIRARPVELRAICEPGDTLEHVITISKSNGS
jgi:hypothetical protein